MGVTLLLQMRKQAQRNFHLFEFPQQEWYQDFSPGRISRAHVWPLHSAAVTHTPSWCDRVCAHRARGSWQEWGASPRPASPARGICPHLDLTSRSGSGCPGASAPRGCPPPPLAGGTVTTPHLGLLSAAKEMGPNSGNLFLQTPPSFHSTK